MPSRRVALVAVWVVGAVVATGTGVLAVQQVAARVSDAPPAPLSASGVEDALETTPVPLTTPTTGSPSTTAPPTATGPTATGPTESVPTATSAAAPRSFSAAGGSIGVTCEGGVPRLLYVTPAQGWAVDEREQEDERVEVRFRSDEAESRLRVACGPDGPFEEPDDD